MAAGDALFEDEGCRLSRTLTSAALLRGGAAAGNDGRAHQHDQDHQAFDDVGDFMRELRIWEISTWVAPWSSMPKKRAARRMPTG